MVVKWKCYKRIILQCLPKDADSNPWITLWWPKLMTSRTCVVHGVIGLQHGTCVEPVGL